MECLYVHCSLFCLCLRLHPPIYAIVFYIDAARSESLIEKCSCRNANYVIFEQSVTIFDFNKLSNHSRAYDTGSVYNDIDLMASLPGEFTCSQRVSVIKVC